MSLGKADSSLRETLKGSSPEQKVRAVLTITGEGGASELDPAPDSRSFGSRKDYRAALIARQKYRVFRDLRPTVQALKKLGLSTQASSLGRVVLVEGRADRVLASLNLPGVAHASLDREFLARPDSSRVLPHFEIGDTIDVHVRDLERGKERIQVYNGVVVNRSGDGSREKFTVRRIIQGEGVERTFPVHSPRIADIVVKRSGKLRRKLYYPRERSSTAVSLKERVPKISAAEAKAAKTQKRDANKATKCAKADPQVGSA